VASKSIKCRGYSVSIIATQSVIWLVPQTAGWIKMALGMEVGLGPVHIELDGDTAPLPKKGTEPSPQFSSHFYCGHTAGCIKMPLGVDVGREVTWSGDDLTQSPRGVCVRWRPSPPPQKVGGDRQIFLPCLFWPNGGMDQDATLHNGRPKPRRLCVRWGPSRLPTKGMGTFPIFGPFYCGQSVGCIKMPLGMEVGQQSRLAR